MPPLPRKVDGTPQGEAAKRNAVVHPMCVRLWNRGREAGRRDTYIGLIDTRTWTFYLAPCFGVDWAVISGVPIDEDSLPIHVKVAGDIARRRYLLQAGLFPGDTECIATSTSDSKAEIIRATKRDLDLAYGATKTFNPVCYVGLGEDPTTQFPTGTAGSFPKFDGKSHQSLSGWCIVHAAALGIAELSKFWKSCLGFAVQRDATGYYIRFASALNVEWGQPSSNDYFRDPAKWRKAMERSPSNTFELRHEPAPRNAVSRGLTRFVPGMWTATAEEVKAERHRGRESRDLPRQWAMLVERILARDLKLGMLRGPDEPFERMVSRGEALLTKLSRFEPLDDEEEGEGGSSSTSSSGLLYRDVTDPGSFGTSSTLI